LNLFIRSAREAAFSFSSNPTDCTSNFQISLKESMRIPFG